MPRRTQDTSRGVLISLTWLSHSLTGLPRPFCYQDFLHVEVLQPHSRWFGLIPVRSPLLRESLLIYVPGLLRWFTSPSVALLTYFIQSLQYRNRFLWVTPFGDLRVNGYVLLTAAYRSLSRPSSPYSSKASAIDLYSLDHIIFPASPLFALCTSSFKLSCSALAYDTSFTFCSKYQTYVCYLSRVSLP